MEQNLMERDRIGLQDFLLLEDYESEEAFIDNLKKRFDENLIYTYIGKVLISINPYKELGIYGEKEVREYKSRYFFDAPPHVFAISEIAFRSLLEENIGQCVLISGESGSGKTEASKKVLEYIAAASNHTPTVEKVKDKLLQSNPLMEAFGNAKTNKNDNSSRFGKYMAVQFEFTGAPKGGNILNYLLEKSRVVYQSPGERNFHIFYQILAGLDEETLREYQLERNINKYHYLSNKTKGLDAGNSDANNFRRVKHAMDVIELSKEEQKDVFDILASILHLGSIQFENNNDNANIKNPEVVLTIGKILKCDLEQLRNSLTNRTIDAHGDMVTSPLNQEMSLYARDALAKAMYDRLFTWLVKRINSALHGENLNYNKAIGILDIYGFEIFKKNNFEQFCINFCNEKLQQLFIELTLRSEQEEYEKECIEWEPVEYFDNKVICSLIEEPHRGIIALLDEECLRPGDPSDLTFLAKINERIASHPHLICHSRAVTAVQKTMGRDDFRLVHYAGDVTYNVAGFLDKNNDLLFRDLKETMLSSQNNIIKGCFFESEIQQKKRPETAITQFRNSLNNLINILHSKEPSYIRCIKPNNNQTPDEFEYKLVSHQVKYLGLMENLRVRRAGFSYRRTYEMFLQRYKCLSKKTWPVFHGPAKDGVQILVNELGYGLDEYRMGRTKIFIRFPKTLFATEDAFQKKKHEIASMVQARYKGRIQRRKYLKMRSAAIMIQKYMRRHLALKEARVRREAATQIRAFIKGFITRNDQPNGYNEKFIANSKRIWLTRLSKNLPKTLLDTAWVSAPRHCEEASILLYKMYRNHLARMYRTNISEGKRKQLELKVVAEKAFRGHKTSYAKSIPNWFIENRIPNDHQEHIKRFIAINFQNEKLVYSTSCTKYDRHGYRPRLRFILMTNSNLYVLDGKTYKQKHCLMLSSVDFCVSNKGDNLMLVRIPLTSVKDKGDLILEIPELIEFCTWIIKTTGKPQIVNIADTSSLNHNLVKGSQGTINIVNGSSSGISKGKDGHLIVVGGQ